MGRVRALQSRALAVRRPVPDRERQAVRGPPRTGQDGSLGRALLVGTVVAALCGCASHTVRVVDMTPPQQFDQVVDETLLLDVGVTVFDANVPEVFDDQVAQNITPEVRRAEANYMAYFAKNLLQSTGNWGAVRVVPRATHAVDVTLTGTIIHSDGERMILNAKARDARGTVWFTKTYEALASKYAYGDLVPVGIDPFHTIYRNIADDMLTYRKALPDATVQAIPRHGGDAIRARFLAGRLRRLRRPGGHWRFRGPAAAGRGRSQPRSGAPGARTRVPLHRHARRVLRRLQRTHVSHLPGLAASHVQRGHRLSRTAGRRPSGEPSPAPLASRPALPRK